MDEAAQVAIVKTCIEHRNANFGGAGYRACVTIDKKHFVKFGSEKTLGSEVATQKHIYHHAESDPDAPRVAKILSTFQEQSLLYVVMEYVELVGPADPGQDFECSEMAFQGSSCSRPRFGSRRE